MLVSRVVLALLSASSLSPHFLRAVIYFNIQVVKGQRKVIGLLKEQIRNVSASLPVRRACGVPLEFFSVSREVNLVKEKAGWRARCHRILGLLREP